jgi:hypothetical protein
MGRRLAILALGIVAAVAAYFGLREGEPPPEGSAPPRQDHRVDPAALSSAASSIDRLRDPAAAMLAVAPGLGFPAALPWAPLGQLGGAGSLFDPWVAALALAPAQGFPAALPWGPVYDVGEKGDFSLEKLLRTRPLDFLQMCADRYEQEVRGYTVTFVKKERIAGKLFPPEKDKYEVIRVAFREKPFSVHFTWQEKPRLASRVLYVEGENDSKMLARPRVTVLPIMTRDVDSPDARNAGRYTIAQFGMGKAMERTVASMRDAQARGALHLRYEGLVKLDEVGGRVCYKFVRTPYDPLEEEGLNELTLYVDRDTWLQVGSVLRDPNGELIAEYFFRDIRLNPDIPEKQFTRGSL